MRIDPRYDALCASRLSWLVIIFAVLHQLNTWARSCVLSGTDKVTYQCHLADRRAV